MRVRRTLAPAGTAYAATDVTALARALLAPGDQRLSTALRTTIGTDHRLTGVASGRAALTMLFHTLRRVGAPQGRDEIILPAYTCYSVAAAAHRAGLRIRLVDTETERPGYDLEQLRAQRGERLLAVVSANLYGMPDDLTAIEAYAREQGLYFIDDAAQCLGGRIDGRAAGTFGDAGVFSLDKGKCLTTLQGGVLATAPGALDEALESAPPPPSLTGWKLGLATLAYALLLRPSLYWIPDGLLDLGGTRYEEDFPLTTLDRRLDAMACAVLPRLETFNARRRDRAAGLRDRLAGIPGVTVCQERTASVPTYTRLPVLLTNGADRDGLVHALRNAGLGGSFSYPKTLFDVPEIRDIVNRKASRADNARGLARRLFTLPTHDYVNDSDMDRIATVLQRHVS